jgi:hypothetical protein
MNHPENQRGLDPEEVMEMIQETPPAALREFVGFRMPRYPGEMVTWSDEEGPTITFTIVDTPRVGVDGLREALIKKYGTIGNPPPAEELGAPGEE